MPGDDFEAIVVGAGPAGSVAARELARRGRHVLLLEAKRFPRPKTCAGGISPWARTNLRELGLWEPVAAEAYEVRGIRLGAPSGRETQWVGAGSAVVLDRSRFDELLARAAVDGGAELREATAVASLAIDGGRTTGVRLATGDVVRARWVIAANGANGRLDADPRPRRSLRTCQARFEGIAFTPHVLEMYFDAEIAPHYGWLFPESDTRANVGLCADARRLAGRPVRDVFARFLDRHFAARCAGARLLGPWRGFPISVTAEIRHHAPPGTLLAGEACRLVNPATGEGISYATYSGALAARLVDEALGLGADPAAVARAYERRLRLRSEASLRAGEWFLRFGMPLVESAVHLGEVPWLRRRLGQDPPTPPAR
jgi:geranylgeranyl reductase family protein